MVRLVFRPYTQVRRTICMSVPLRASTRVSPGFTLLRHSSPSFGSQPLCSFSNLSQKIEIGRLCKTKKSKLLPSLRVKVYNPRTYTKARLLGPCFKTGRKKPFRQRHRTKMYRLINTSRALNSRSKAHLRENYIDLDLRTKPSVGIQPHTRRYHSTAAKQVVPSRYGWTPN